MVFIIKMHWKSEKQVEHDLCMLIPLFFPGLVEKCTRDFYFEKELEVFLTIKIHCK